MSKKFIFDLDYTLYSKKDVNLTNTTIFYNSFNFKPFLNKLLKNLKENKYIFSNGNKSHVDYVLKKMHLDKNIFKGVANADDFENLKPSIEAYEYCIKNFKLQEKDTIFFFEDTLQNLKTAKELGWKTVLIDLEDDYNNDIDFVDYKFNTIEQALLFFTTLNNYQK